MRSFGLRAKILIFALVCVLLPLLAVGAYLLDQNERVLGDKVREGLANAVSRRADRVDEWLRQRLQEAHSWSLSFVVYENVEAILGGARRAESARGELAQYLVTVLGHHPDFESLFVTDLEGRVLAATREESPDPDWSAGVDPGRMATLTPLRHSKTLGRRTLLVVQGITSRAGRPIAWLFARVDVRALETLLESSEQGPEFWLADREGRLVAQRGSIVADPGRARFPIALEDSSASPSAAEGVLPEMGRVVYSSRELNGPLRGRLVAASSASVAYRPLAQARQRLLLGGVAVLLLVLVVNLVASRGVSESLRRLADGARQMSEGDLAVSLPVSGRDEVAALTASFNEMARRVRESHEAMERTNAELREANRALETLSITDGLTGLYNHRHFYETLARELQRSAREHNPLSLLLVDLDHFKQFNDRHGHTEGDAALRRVGQQIVASIRGSDLAFRYGGEELAVLLPACTAEQALEVAEKIRATVETESRAQGRPATLSVGAATCPEHATTAAELVKMADAALYEAKRSGRNRVAAAERSGASKRPAVTDPSPTGASRH